MNELQKRFEEMQERLEGVIKGQRDTIILYEEINKKLRSQLTWRSVEEPPEVPGMYLIMWNDLVLLSYYYQTAVNKENKWLQFNSTDTYKNVAHWLPIPKLD